MTNRGVRRPSVVVVKPSTELRQHRLRIAQFGAIHVIALDRLHARLGQASAQDLDLHRLAAKCALEFDDEARLLEACGKSKNKELKSIVSIAVETGLRRAEILGLTWDRVDLSRGVVRLEITKSGKRREVPMRQVVYHTLIALPGQREGLVFRTRSIRNDFDYATEAAGLGDFHFHDTRHHFASWFMMRGGSLQGRRGPGTVP